ncbi:alpha/beta fold hydrolase [Modestobacter sp. NPDC049651]|uniref:alpha/beta fold hydrolase n=1 Tax=unclassified Modestobacter TaxID=2643866 RepID=UPI0033FDD3FD
MNRFLFVHGAFHGAWCWDDVIAALRAQGHQAEAVDLPGSGADGTPVAEVTLERYAERVCQALRTAAEPAVLVAHSMGGVAATQAAARCPEAIAALVYVAAFAPGNGQSLVDLTQLPEGAGDGVQANMVVDGEPPVAVMPPAAAREVFFEDCDDAAAERALRQIGPQPVLPFVTPVELPDGGLPVPCSYVLTSRDRAIPPALQRRMAREAGAPVLAELDSDHSPFLSHADELVAALVRAAGAGAH